jgi:CubicO group peptidase (beta-lactamase class C family)
MLACGGALDGRRILAPEHIDIIRAPRTIVRDEVFDGPSRVGLGYGLGGNPAAGADPAKGHTGGEFGHSGNGGSLGFADPARRLSFGLTKNLMRADPDPTQTAAYRVAQAIREHLDGAG